MKINKDLFHNTHLDKKTLKDLSSRILMSRSIEHCKKLVQQLVRGYVQYNQLIPASTSLYRARLLDDKPNTIQEFSYPPKNVRLGRCNRENKPVFYCSTAENSSIFELKELKVGETVILGEWKSTVPILTFSAGYNQYHFEEALAQRKSPNLRVPSPAYHTLLQHGIHISQDINETVKDLFDKIFASPGDKYYIQSIAITEAFLIDMVPPYPAIMYPSVAMDKNGDNLAISTTFVDKYMKLVSCQFIKIFDIGTINQNNAFGVELHDYAENFDGERILWKELGRHPGT